MRLFAQFEPANRNGGKTVTLVSILFMQKNENEFSNLTGSPIFSIDTHPDGTKFATGGSNNDSGQVVIWNLLPVIDEDAENSGVSKKLCQMDNHLACVNCVRWSVSGSTLASGGDDKIIMLWKKGIGPSAVFGSSGASKSVENWRCQTILRGHSGSNNKLFHLNFKQQIIQFSIGLRCSRERILFHLGDILDLAWSPQDRWLASSSVDNTIIIWCMNSFQSVTTLKGHSGLVKGVAWDPVII